VRLTVLNTALKYKIPRNKKKTNITKYKQTLKRASAEAREINRT